MKPQARRTAFVLLLASALHIGLGMTLLHSGLHLEPDHPAFLIGARSFATGHGYQDLSDPANPPLGRPPGMSLLLAPVVGWFGYDVVACKWWILVLGTMTCWLGYAAANRIAGVRAGELSALLLAVTPLTLIHDARLMSETPHAMLTLAILLCVLPASRTGIQENAAASEGNVQAEFVPVSWHRLLLLIVLVIFAEKVRSQAIVLWPALAIWGLFRRDRKRLLTVFAVGILISRAIDLLPTMGTSALRTYASYMQSILLSHGVKGVLNSIGNSALLYLSCPVGIWLPPLWPGIADDGILPGDFVPSFVRVLLSAFVVLGVLRLLRRRFREWQYQSEALFVAAYLIGSLCVLLIWPHRMSRLFFPLIPLLLVYFCGYFCTASFGYRRIEGGLGLLAYLIGTCGLVYQQTIHHEARATWTPVQTFLRDETPPYTRVITNVKSLFLRTYRYQYYAPETTLSVQEFNGYIFELGAKYVIFADWEHEPQIQQNPAIEFRPLAIETGRDHLWEIAPNLNGNVNRPLPVFLQTQLTEAVNAAQDPAPSKLRPNELSHILRVHGKPELAEKLIRKYLAQSKDDPMHLTDLHFELGNALLEQGKGREATEYYEKAKAGYNSDLYQSAIVACMGVAKDLTLAEGLFLAPSRRAAILENIANAYVDVARWSAAKATAQKAAQLDARRAHSHIVLARIARLTGDLKTAKSELDIAFSNLANHPAAQETDVNTLLEDATSLLLAIDGPERLKQEKASEILAGSVAITIDPADPRSFVQLCEILIHQKLQGMAYAIAEQGTLKHASSAEVWYMLAQLKMQFGQFEDALTAVNQSISLSANPEALGLRSKIEAVIHNPPVK